MRKLVCRLRLNEVSGRWRDAFQSRLQMLRVHVFLVAPLGTGHMAQPCACRHEGRTAVREGAHHTSPAADFPVEPLNDAVPPPPARARRAPDRQSGWAGRGERGGGRPAGRPFALVASSFSCTIFSDVVCSLLSVRTGLPAPSDGHDTDGRRLLRYR